MSNTLRSFLSNNFAEKSYNDPLKTLLWGQFSEISEDFDLTKMQDSWSWKNTYVARNLSLLLLDEKGEPKKDLFLKAIGLLESNEKPEGVNTHYDARRERHLLKILKLFYEDVHFLAAFKRIQRPHGHVWAEKIIRETLSLPTHMTLKDGHAKQAAFSALLTFLRQNVGSCFATAPAIIIQQEIPERFLEDIAALFGKGRIVRTRLGVEHAVPLSLSWGMGDLFRPFILATFGPTPLSILARSPGLQAAFMRALLIDPALSARGKKEACEKLLIQANIQTEDAFAVWNADRILKKVLMTALGVTPTEISQFRERPFVGPLRDLVILPQASSTGGGVSRYLKAYEEAKKAFVAVTDNPLLKSWEFTLASFAEVKADFAKWNLFISLGFDPQEPKGIGRDLQEKIEQKLTSINAEIEVQVSHYDHLYAQARYLEGRMRRAATDTEVGWIRAEYEIRRAELAKILGERDRLYDKGRKLAGLIPTLATFYGEKIPAYFQEVYDAEMVDVSQNPYDDSPAGFRLLYKHGRTNTALWTLIESGQEYVKYLTAFFVTTEPELKERSESEGIENEVSELITDLVTFVKKEDFLESSIQRLARTYGEKVILNPLEHLELVKRKPWAYISGGTVDTLTACYFYLEKLDEKKRWVESETELLAFYLDTLKELPHALQNQFKQESEFSMLAFSPTHAFVLKPGWKEFRKGWESDEYSYTWIRDAWSVQALRFLDDNILDHRMQDAVIEQLLAQIPYGYREVIRMLLKEFNDSLHPKEFRENVLENLSRQRWIKESNALQLIQEELDSALFRLLPLFPESELRTRLEQIFSQISEMDMPERNKLLKNAIHFEEKIGRYRILSSSDLHVIAKALCMETLGHVPFSLHEKILEAMRQEKLAYPAPILVADSNWVKTAFGFVVSPGTGNIEFWRFDESGSEGRPLSQWKAYLNGSSKKEWGIYTDPRQYH